MALSHKIYRPLWFWHCQLHKSAYFLLNQIPNSRKVVPLNIIIAENSDINEKIKGDLSNIEWLSLREKCLQIQQITPTIVDSTIIDICLQNSKVDTAIAYFKFLRENNYPLSVAVIGKYLRLYFLKYNSLTDIDKTEIIKTYNTLREKYPYLDSVTAEHCIISLCLTDQWEKTYEIIEMIKITTTPGISVYSAFIGAAFRNGKSDIAWKTLLEIALRGLIPQNIVYTSHLKYCKDGTNHVFNDRIEKMFNFWAEHNIMPYYRIISAYIDTAVEYGWSATPATISITGSCRHCSQSLSKITFSEENFQDLVKSVMNKMIIGPDIYCKTNPQELRRFKKFIEDTKPYDIVIDGLNISYFKKNNLTLKTLLVIIEYFNKRGKKILVLTRKHQKKLPIFNDIKQKALIFFTDNISIDDPYMLYATMASGKNAQFVSLDLMRQHKHSLKDLRLQRDFKKWQFSHQYFFTMQNNKLHIQKPFVYVPAAQKNGDFWHIPYVDDNFTYAESFKFPDKWYCVKYNKNK